MEETIYRIFEYIPQKLCFYERVGRDLSSELTHFHSFFAHVLRRRFSVLDIRETTINPAHLYEECYELTWEGRNNKWAAEKKLLA